MRKGDKCKKILGVIVILAIIVSVFGGVVSAEDVSGGLKQSVADAEIQTAVGNLSSEELTKALDADSLHQLPATSGKISYFCPDCCPTSAWGEPLGVSCGGDDAARYWFVAMRWPYYDPCTGFLDMNAKSWWHNKKVLVTNPANGKQVVLAVKDWGPCNACFPNCPQSAQERVVDVSKTALDAFGAETDDTVNIEFADQSAELGVVDSSSSYKFGMGDWVRTTDELNVRQQPKLTGEFIWTAPKGSLGVVIDGPQSDSGFTWYQIRYDYAPNDPKPTVIGWSSDHRLETHSTPSPPPQFLTLPFTDPSIKIQQGWIYHWRPDEPNAHKGIDYIKTSSSGWQSFDVVAAADGRAMWAETTSYGNIVRIQHNEKDYEGNNYFTLYAHLESVAEGIPKKQPNDENYASWKDVNRGEYIGKSGETGAQGTGIHLHFEAQRKAYVNYKTDPYDLYKIRNSYPGWESYTNSGSRYLWTTDPPITPSVNQPPIAHASDLSNQPDVMYPDTLYEVTAKYYDPDGRTNLDLCTLVLSHPSDLIMMGWDEDHKMPIEASAFINDGDLAVDYIPITDSYEGYQLTWKFKLSDTWPEAETCIDFCVLATDDDGLQSELLPDCDNTDASFVVNQAPTLSSGYVTPASGDTSTTFDYYVTYTDSDGDAPTTKYVYVDGSPHTMTMVSGSYTSGATFKYSTTLSAGSHNYYFYFDDGHSHTERLPTSGTYSGPTVSTPNQPPTLTSGYVTPASGDTSTTFDYYVTYTDSDGDAPTTKYVYVDGSPHTMTMVSGSYTSGATFKYSTTLSAGSHNYYFYFEDGHSHTVRLPTSGTYSGPTVSTPNDPPNTPSIPSGPTLGKIGISYTYSTVTTDPNSDNIYYWFDWGDGTNSGWIGPYPSGTSGSTSKEWSNPDTYNVKTKAKDEYGAESSPLWSDSLPVCINGLWEDDPSNPCKERRLTCSGTYEYKNKPDGTICGHGEWEDDPANQCKERREIQKCVSGTCTPSGEYEYKNKADGTICGHGEWEDDPANQCKERREIQKCVSGTCTPSGEYEYRNKADGTICGCTARNTLKRCYGGVCTDTGICNSSICGADAACDGKEPGDSCGGGRKCDSTCKCGGQAVGEDYGVFRNGRWYVDTDGDQKTNLYFWYGTTGDKPVVGDFNDDGSDDYGVFRNDRWYIDTTGNQKTNLCFWYGTTGDKPVVGDFNGDTKDDYGLFRNGRWYIDTTGNQKTDLAFWYGTTGDKPVVGDFNGDGSDDYGVFRNGRWYIDTTGNQKTNLAFWYGTTGDKPVAGDIG